jgi:hypothetical protein
MASRRSWVRIPSAPPTFSDWLVVMFRRFFSAIAFLLITLTISISVSTSGRQATPSVLVHTSDFDGVIFSADMKAFQKEFPTGVRYWTPSESDVLAAERELIPFLSSSKDARVKEILSKIKTYKRQYVGVVIAGRKYIYFNLFCMAPNYWTREEVVVFDGGTCFFNVWFSSDTKAFSKLRVNGLA